MFHKAKAGKGSLPVVAFHVTKRSCGAYSGKKGEELGGVVGILDCFVLVHMVY